MSDIMNTLGQLGRGRFLESLDESVRDAVDAVRGQAEKGRKVKATVTATFTLETLDNDHLGIRLHGAVTSKLPGSPPSESLFFAGADGTLVREDPRQHDLLRDVSATSKN